MRKLLFSFTALGALALSSGCVYSSAVQSVQGRAYVTRTTPFGGDFWNCDATSGEPTCYQTQKQDLPPGTNK